MAGQALCVQAEQALRSTETNANPAHALSQVRAASRDLVYVFSNPTHAALLGNITVTETEFPNFIQACKQYGLAKDIVEMHDKQIELFQKPPVIPDLLNYAGNLYVTSGSTLKTKAKATKSGGKHGVETDFRKHFQDSFLWTGREKLDHGVVVKIRGGATLG